MSKAIRRIVAGALERQGYSLTRLRDPFRAQAQLLRVQQVRTVFDLGANEGDTVARYLEHFDSANVFAFEPSPDCVRCLRERYSRDDRVRVVETAIADSEGGATLQVSHGSKTHSLKTRPSTGPQYLPDQSQAKERIPVHTTTLDRFCAEESIDTVDVLKIDVEGAELQALEGAKTLLSREAVKVILLETMFVEHYAGQGLYHQLAHLLSAHGYSLFDLYDLRRSPANGQLRYANALFVSERIRSSAIEGRSLRGPSS